MNRHIAPSPNFLKLIDLYCILHSIIFLVSCRSSPTEHYGFITTLGTDTIGVESVMRQGNEIISDEVDRFPRVRVRHAVIKINSDGSILHLVMDIHTPSEPREQRERKVTADITNNNVHILKTDGTGNISRVFTTDGGIVEAHIPQMYSLYELCFAAAFKHEASSKTLTKAPFPFRQFYIDREFDHFPLGSGSVTLVGAGKAEISHDWLSGKGQASMDSNYHMLSYSGEHSTYKVEVRRLSSPPDIKTIAERFEAMETKTGTIKELSVRDTMRAQIGNATFTVDYSRPLMRGRKLLNGILPYDYVWRTGANAATQFTTTVPVKLAGIQIPSGTYTLWTVPHQNSVELIVNKQHGQWGTEYNSKLDLGTTRMTSQEVATPLEEFTISILPSDSKHGTLIIEWGDFRWTAPIEIIKK
jgi:Protein of unknown function (DUF2911).